MHNANGSTLEDPAITYGIVFSNFMSKGVYTFKGGTDFLITKMRDELLKNNVDLIFPFERTVFALISLPFRTTPL